MPTFRKMIFMDIVLNNIYFQSTIVFVLRDTHFYAQNSFKMMKNGRKHEKFYQNREKWAFLRNWHPIRSEILLYLILFSMLP